MDYLYARTSTKHQENGLEDQIAKLQEWAADQGQPHELIAEQASARTLAHRPLLVEALRKLDKEGGRLVVTTLTRLSRSTLNFYDMVRRADRNGWSLVVLDMDFDTSTANGRLLAGMLMQVGEWERAIISERTKAGLDKARERGVHLGRASTVPDSTRMRIDQLRAQGLSWRKVAERLNADGVPTPSGKGRWHPTSAPRYHEGE